jgi:hypothetical protein
LFWNQGCDFTPINFIVIIAISLAYIFGKLKDDVINTGLIEFD